jgi:hypothetical protein
MRTGGLKEDNPAVTGEKSGFLANPLTEGAAKKPFLFGLEEL